MTDDLTFEDACNLVRERRSDAGLCDDDKLMLYVYYKVGTGAGTQPSTTAPVLSAKRRYWQAWKTFGPALDVSSARLLYTAMVRDAVLGAA